MKSRLRRATADSLSRLGEIGGFVGEDGTWVGGIGNWSRGRGFLLGRLLRGFGFGAFALLVAAIVELLVGGLFLHGLIIVTHPRLSFGFPRNR
jgi:hypothetical protein